MRRILLFFLFFVVKSYFVFANDKHEYTIIGTLPDSIDNVSVYLMPFDTSSGNEDSTIVVKGRFVFHGVTDTLKFFSIRCPEYKSMENWVVIEPGIISYCYQTNESQVYACAKGTDLNNVLTDSIVVPSMQMAKYGEELMTGSIDMEDPQMAERLSKMQNDAINLKRRLLWFIKENMYNPVGESVFLMYSPMLHERDLSDILPYLSENIRQKYNDRKNGTNLSTISIGQQYIPFSGKMPDNEYFRLSDIIKQKKLVLIDFWASWCGPCIKEMPTIAQLYESYKDRGLEIVGISIDENELSWKNALKKNDMSWIQIISKKGNSDDIAKMYGISLIPYTVLINSKGEIVGINLRGQELKEKIKNFLE